MHIAIIRSSTVINGGRKINNKIDLTFELVFGGNFWTITPMVTQSPSISLFPLIFVGICEIITILRPSILFSMTTDEIKGLMIRKLENLSFEKFSSSRMVVLVSASVTVFLVVASRLPSVELFLPLGPRICTVFAVFVLVGSTLYVGFFFSVDLLSSAFLFSGW